MRQIADYLKERFPLHQFVPLSLVFGLNTSIFISLLFSQSPRLEKILFTSLALGLFLFRLRLFDEFKDYEHDRKYYPSRPVARGAITLEKLKILISVVLVSEVILSLVLGAFVFFSIALGYSLLLYKELFVRDWLRSHFAVYIIVHEVLAFPIFYYLYSINAPNPQFVFNQLVFVHSLFLTLSLFSLEVARKFRSKEADRAMDTYTANFGNGGAGVLLTLIAIFGLILVIFLGNETNSLVIVGLSVVVLGVIYLLSRIWLFYRQPDRKNSKFVFMSTILFVFLSNSLLIWSLWRKI